MYQAELNAPQDVITCEKKRITAASLQSSLPQCIPMKTEQFAVISSIYTLGGLLGALAAGPSCNRIGRLNTIRLTAIFHILGPVLETLAPNIALLGFGRTVSGIGSGASLVVVPIYISEIAPPKEKGLFGALTQIMINLGILLAQVLGYFLSRDNLWRIILAVAGATSLLQLLALSLVPESPKWLAENKRPQDAREILRRMRGRQADLDEEVKAWNVDSSREDICRFLSLLVHQDTQLILAQRKKRPFSMPNPALIQGQIPKPPPPPSAFSPLSCTPAIVPPSLPSYL